jgi:hypothetical protein
MTCPVAPLLPNSAIRPPKRPKTGHRQPNRGAGERGDGLWRPLIHARCSRGAGSLLSGGGQQPVWQLSGACSPLPVPRLQKSSRGQAGALAGKQAGARASGPGRRHSSRGLCTRAPARPLRQAGADASAGRRASFSNRGTGSRKQEVENWELRTREINALAKSRPATPRLG